MRYFPATKSAAVFVPDDSPPPQAVQQSAAPGKGNR
jgi:hypothetical protein